MHQTNPKKKSQRSNQLIEGGFPGVFVAFYVFFSPKTTTFNPNKSRLLGQNSMTKVYSPESSSKVTVCKRTMPSAEVSPGLSTVDFPCFFEWKIDVWYARSGVFCWWYFNTHIYLGKTKSSSSHFFLLIFVWVEIAYAQTNTLEIEIVRFKKNIVSRNALDVAPSSAMFWPPSQEIASK